MNTTGVDPATKGPETKKVTTYFVNGERQETDEKELKVKAILANAGFDPTSEWVLSRDEPPEEFKDQDELVHIHQDERFTATRSGPTPTS